jgi:tetratricopeptide (TPR) repeat protein
VLLNSLLTFRQIHPFAKVDAKDILIGSINAEAAARRTAREQRNCTDSTQQALLCISRLLSLLSSKLNQRYEKRGELTDFHIATAISRLSANCLPDGHRLQPQYLVYLNYFLFNRFEQLGEISDIEESIAILRCAVDLTPEGDPTKPMRLSDLSDSLSVRFRQLDDLADIENAIAAARHTVNLTPDNNPNKAVCILYLSNSLIYRFERLGEMSDINDAAAGQRCAAELVPDDDPTKGSYLSNLGISLGDRFERLGDLKDLDEAIAAGRCAVDLTARSQPGNPVYLSNLAKSLQFRFERLGNIADLDEAIARVRLAVQIEPDGRPRKSIRLDNLGNILALRYQRLGELLDIDDAIEVQRRAVQLTPDDHLRKSMFLSSLGNTLRTRFHRCGELSDLEEAIVAGQSAVALLTDGHPEAPMHLWDLGISLRCRFERLDKMSDLEDSITVLRRAVQLTPNDHPDKPSRLSHLSISLNMRFQLFGELSDIESAVAFGSEAVQLTPDGHYSKAELLSGLGSSWKARLCHSPSQSHFNLAYRCFVDAIHCSPIPPAEKLHASLVVTDMCERFPLLVGSEEAILQAHKHVLSAIPPLIWLGQTIAQRYDQIIHYKVSKSIASAASAAIAADRPSLALEWLEEGRNIVWSQLHQFQNPLDVLRTAHPKLADELQRVSGLLQSAVYREGARASKYNDTYSSNRLEEEARRHRELAEAYEKIVEDIRALTGFDSFLHPKTLAELSRACRDRLVVVINVHHSRCNALVLCPPGLVVHVPLPEPTLANAERMRAVMVNCICGRSVRLTNDGPMGAKRASVMAKGINSDMRRVLRYLWLHVVQPVLSAVQTELSCSSASAG